MVVATGCGCKEVYRFLILLIPTPLVSVLFYSSIPYFWFIFLMFFVLYYILTWTNSGGSKCAYTLLMIAKNYKELYNVPNFSPYISLLDLSICNEGQKYFCIYYFCYSN